jgi:hypothetical protein
MQTQMLGQLDIAGPGLLNDVAQCAKFRYSEHYSEFLCSGAWKSCMLWAPGGDAGDDVIAHYDTGAVPQITECGKQLSFLRDIIERVFAVDRLVFARIAVMSGSVGIPHRDYIELDDLPETKRPACRLHLPLVTSDDCYFTEDNVIFRMKFGEVWVLDVSRVHSSAVLSELQRMHLILDFNQTANPAQLVKFPVKSRPGIPEDSVCHRDPLSEREREDILSLAPIVDLDNLRDAFGIVVKKHYRKDGGQNFVWGTLDQIAQRHGDAAVRKRIQELHQYFTMERSD